MTETSERVIHSRGAARVAWDRADEMRNDFEVSGIPIVVPSPDNENLGRDWIIAAVLGGLPEAEDHSNARLLSAAWTSYDKHFGPSAVEAAESDRLGEAIEVISSLRAIVGDHVAEHVRRAHQNVLERAGNLLSSIEGKSNA